MIEAAEAAQRFIANRQRADLDTDEMLLFALVRAAEIIGEAASKVSDEPAERCPLFPGSKSSQCAIASAFPRLSATGTKV